MSINIRKIGLFILLAFALDWGLAGTLFALGGGRVPGLMGFMGIVYMFGPAAAALIVQKWVYREEVVRPLGISFRLNWWFLAAWLLPVVLAFGSLGVSLLMPGVTYSTDMSGVLERMSGQMTPEQLAQARAQLHSLPVSPLVVVFLGFIAGMIAGVTVNAVAAFGEELGWRGFLQKELAPLGFWKSAALIGIIWGVWHAPLILHGHNYPQHPKVGVLMMTAFALLLSPMFSYVRLRARSVIAAAVIHGTMNGVVGVSLMLVKGGSDLTVGAAGLAGLVVLAIIDLGILIYDRIVASQPVETELRQLVKITDV